MRRIARLTIENFQSHTHSDLAFASGLNVIIGPSDQGKSAILRALRWALYNEPRGSDFVRTGARECRVTVTMSDGAAVQRELTLSKSGSPSRNRYVVTLPGSEPQVFEGFGTEPPAEVLRAHGMPQVMLDTDKRVMLSFGGQLEGPFLMAETGSLRARAIGRLLGVHVVDAATRSTQRDLRTVRQEVQRVEREVLRYEAELAPYADIPDQEARLAAAEVRLSRAEELSHRLQRLQALQEQMDRAGRDQVLIGAQLARLARLDQAGLGVRAAEEQQARVRRLVQLQADLDRVTGESRQARVRIEALKAISVAEERARAAQARQERLSSLSRLQTDLKSRTAELGRTESVVAQLARVERAEAIMQETGARLRRLEDLRQKQSELSDVSDRIAKGSELLRAEADRLSALLREFGSVLGRLGRCPTCSQPISPESVPRIVAELAGGTDAGHTH